LVTISTTGLKMVKSDQKNKLIIEEEISSEEYLLTKAEDQGFVTYADILTAFPKAEENIEKLEDIMTALIESGVDVGSLTEINERKGQEGERLTTYIGYYPGTGNHIIFSRIY